MNKPNFFLVGAPKCGTSALASYLGRHPDIFMSNPKEPLYYMAPESGLSKFQNEKHYLNIFENKGSCKIVGESSVWYLYSDHAREQIKIKYPTAKIIVMTRDRISFIESLHSQLVFGGIERGQLEKSWKENRSRHMDDKYLSIECHENWRLMYSELSNFKKFIKLWKQDFEEGNVLVINQELLAFNPSDTYSLVLNFLGVTPVENIDFNKVNANKAVKNKLVHRVMLRLGRTNSLVNFATFVKSKLGITSFGAYQFIRNLNHTHAQREPMPLNLRAEMTEYYRGK